MTDDQKIEKLETAFKEVIWMAIRYADGRHTYAPSMVRDAIERFQTVFPEWKPETDSTIKQLSKEDSDRINFKSDYLHDLF
jgi:hypothetical protein